MLITEVKFKTVHIRHHNLQSLISYANESEVKVQKSQSLGSVEKRDPPRPPKYTAEADLGLLVPA